jgi:hypothetical protein
VKPYFGMQTRPGYYAWNLLLRTGINAPPVPIEPIAEELNLKVKFFRGSEHFDSSAEEEDLPSVKPQNVPFLFDDTPYWRQPRVASGICRRPQRLDGLLRRRSRTIWLNCEKTLGRQRMSFGHECGHDAMPSHQGLSYVDHGCLIEPGLTNSYEQEATSFGAHLIMPPAWFFNDMHDAGMGLHAVDLLAQQYFTSLEATAIHYVRFNMHPYALVIAQPNPAFPAIESAWGFPLVVRYSVRNYAFQDFIAPGTWLPRPSPLTEASLSRVISTHQKISGWALGLRGDRRYLVDCRPWGTEGDVIALVWQIPEGKRGGLFSLNQYFLGSHDDRSNLVTPAQKVLVSTSV